MIEHRDTLIRNLRFSWRLAKHQPWTIVATVLSIAVGIGANTAVTSVVDTVLLNPLGLQHADRLVAATVHITKLQMKGANASGPEFRDLQSGTDIFSAVAASEPRSWTLAGDQPLRLAGVAVTSGFFKVFEAKPELGTFAAGTREDLIVISDALWRTRFGQSSNVLGRKIILDGSPYEVIGVTRADFHFPAQAEAWMPRILHQEYGKRGVNMTLSLYARLRPGVSLQRAQAAVDHELLKLDKDFNDQGYGVDVEPLARRIAGDLRVPLIFLWLSASVLMLAACANVASLLMARAGRRRKEIAIRISVGASKWQILTQLMTESLLLAMLGGIAGLAVAWLLLAVLKQQQAPYQYLLKLVSMNRRLLTYGLGLAFLSSLLFGIVPAIELMRQQHSAVLVRTRRKWFQNIYIVGQVGASLLLLIVMGLLLKSLKQIELLRPGFDSHNLTTALLIKPPSNLNSFYEQVLANLRATPGVQSAALTYPIPFAAADMPTLLFDIKSRHHKQGDPEWQGEGYQVTPDYFRTLRIPLLSGRLIQDTDTSQTARVCVIDSGMAQRFFPNEDPLGQEIELYGDWARVVGVVASVRDETVEHDLKPVVYYPLAQIPYFPEVGLVVRAAMPAGAITRAAVFRANARVPVFDMKTMDERVAASEATRSILTLLVSIFAVITFLLAALGIHGVVAQVVAERTAEIGVRMAVGASAGNVFRRFVMQGLRLAAVGIVLGLTVATGCSGLLRSLLYQVEPMDPLVILFGVSAILLVTTLAVLTPAWRASRVDPQVALRSE